MEEISYKSFAKINIGLNVISKRADGYHNLETIFYPLKLHDTLTIKKSDKLRFYSNTEITISTEDNLIIKAIKLLENFTKVKFNVNISLNKVIPIGAGLGGGSSNAAFTLKALNELFDLKISNQNLIKLALMLGSDVPLFLFPLPAYAESRGEILYKIQLNIKSPILIVNPGIHISTKLAFSRIKPHKPEQNIKEIIETYPSNYKKWNELITNDFEKIILEEYAELKEIKNHFLEFGSDFCLMTGTGSTFYGIFTNPLKLEQAEKFFINKNYFVYIETPN